MTTEVAKDAFNQHNYLLACEFYETCLSENRSCPSLDVYYGYGDSLANLGRLKESFDVYAHICNLLYGIVPIDKLKHLVYSLVDSIKTLITWRTNSSSSHQSSSSREATCSNLSLVCSSSSNVDPLLCPVCEDILKYPVTSICGHTFCRQCCFGRTHCSVCGQPYATADESAAISFEQDVLVRRLVEKWWGPQLRAAEFNDEAQRCLENDLFDEALKSCNQSLELAPTSVKGLLLRSHVLYRLNHYQSSLADADSALKISPTSHQAYHRRALALTACGHSEEALIALCLSICLDTNSSNVTVSQRNEVARLLQKILASVIRTKSSVCNNSIRRTMLPLHSNKFHHRKRHKNGHFKMYTTVTDPYPADLVVDFDDEADQSFIHYLQGRTKRRIKLSDHHGVDNDDDDRNDNCSGLDSEIIPKQNQKLRSLLDRILQEVEKIRRIEPKPVLLQVNPARIENSDFDCVLCGHTLWKPITTPCGHTYCWVCLDRAMDYSAACPLCMAPLIEQFRSHRSITASPILCPTLISLNKRQVTKFIDAAMQRFIPTLYGQRQSQEIEREPSVPIFICTTAFPSVSCPLFVYEPRYRLMVRRAIESGARQFGIALPQTTRTKYVDYGTLLEIRDCLQLIDGCSILSTVGRRRFRVMARGEKDGYDTAKIELIEDELVIDKQADVVKELHERVLLKAISWYESLPAAIKAEIEKSFGPMPDLEDDWLNLVDGPTWAWWIISILPLSHGLKVGILATTRLEKRLRAIEKTLNLEFIAAQQKRASTICTFPGPPQQSQHQCEGLTACQFIDCCQRVPPVVVVEEPPLDPVVVDNTIP